MSNLEEGNYNSIENIEIVASEFDVNTNGGVMEWGWGIFSHFCPLVPIKHCLNAVAYLNIVADHPPSLYHYSGPII